MAGVGKGFGEGGLCDALAKSGERFLIQANGFAVAPAVREGDIFG